MIYYFGNSWGLQDIEHFPEANPICYSYFYRQDRSVSLLKEKGVTGFLDSGAFSYHQAMRKRGSQATAEQVNEYQDAYAKWVKSSNFEFDFHVCFDSAPTPKAVLASIAYLRKRGLRTIPVFHNGTSSNYLKTYMDSGYGLIGLSRANFRSQKSQTRPFLDACFNVRERGGYKTKFHGFACTGSEVAEYPWWSVDSTYWLIMAATGEVLQLEGLKLTREFSSARKTKAGSGNVMASREERARHNIRVIKTLVERINDKGTPRVRKALF